MDRTPPRHPTSWNLSAPATCKQEMTSQVEAKHRQRSRHIRALSVALVLRTDSECCYTRAVHSVMFRLSLAVVVKPFFLQNTSFTALDERMNLRPPRSRCGSRFKHVQNVCDVLSKLSWFEIRADSTCLLILLRTVRLHTRPPDGVETPSSLFTHYLLQPASSESVPFIHFPRLMAKMFLPTIIASLRLSSSVFRHVFHSCCQRLGSVKHSVSAGAEGGNFIIIVFPIKRRQLKQKCGYYW